MSEWTETILGELAMHDGIKTGPFGTTLKASEYSTDGVPVISVGEIGQGILTLRPDTPRVSEEVTRRLPQFLLRQGDIVFGRKGAVERSAWISDAESGWFLGSDGLRLRVSREFSSRYVAYYVRQPTIQTWIRQHAGGSTLLSLNQQTLSAIPIRFPSLTEQQAIAEVLGALDDKIAANTRLAATADELVRTAYARLTYQAGSMVPLRSIAEHVRRNIDPADANGAYVGLEHLPRRNMWLSEHGDARDVSSTKSRFRKGDVLFGKLRPYFHKVVSAPVDGVCSTDILVLRAIDPDLTELVLAASTSDEAIERATATSEGTRMPRAKWKDLGELEVPDPASPYLTDFAAHSHAIREAVESVIRENRTLAETRDALLPQLMSGKLRVGDIESSAEALGA